WSYMPAPVLLSLIMMIGRRLASSGLDLIKPCHSARRPPIELALPISTANRVCWTAIAGAGGSLSPASGAVAGAAAATSVAGTASALDFSALSASAFSAFSGCTSFEAAGSSGAMIDFDATSGIVGSVADVAEDCGTSDIAAAIWDGGAACSLTCSL